MAMKKGGLGKGLEALFAENAMEDEGRTVTLPIGEIVPNRAQPRKQFDDEALAELEKLPLEQLIDHSFGSIFPNMDAKWLRVYERTALYGETLEITDYSPEIDTELKIVCFPTFPGHCGCMLFDRRRIQTVQSSTSEDNRTKP